MKRRGFESFWTLLLIQKIFDVTGYINFTDKFDRLCMLLSDERKLFPMFHGKQEGNIEIDDGMMYHMSHLLHDVTSNFDHDTGKFICRPSGWYFITFAAYGERE